ncbi:MAG: LysR family transcriptional regulator [Pseudolabrys sp.]
MRISKSATSAHVQRLEEGLGVRLLHRTTRRISLTEAGAAYYRRCARIVAEAESTAARTTRPT